MVAAETAMNIPKATITSTKVKPPSEEHDALEQVEFEQVARVRQVKTRVRSTSTVIVFTAHNLDSPCAGRARLNVRSNS